MANRIWSTLIVSIFALGVFACGGEDGPNNNSDPSADAGTDAQVEPDATTNGDPGCAQLLDCPQGEFCYEGACQTYDATCAGRADFANCSKELEAYGDDIALRAVCRDDQCEVSCWFDSDCPTGSACTDNGRCVAYDGDLDAPIAGGEARKPLEAGVGEAPLNFPIGISLAGYGFRSMAGGEGRYAASMRATHGQYHELDARAVHLDNGERRMMFIRLPIIFPTMALHEAVAQGLQERTGQNWRDTLVIAGTHTHSGPARYWHLPPNPAFDLGTLGVDQYHQQAFEWLVESTLTACDQALDSTAPAQFGWTIVESFDTDDAIAADRWGETPPFDDNRLLLLRVDDTDGNPLAALVSLGIHGTYNESDYLTGDSTAGIERGFEAELGRRYGRSVPVLFINENGGTMSPKGGRFGHQEAHLYESLGSQFAERAIDPFDAIETDSDVELDARTHRFELGLENVGYEDGWPAPNSNLPGKTQPHGAVQCFLDADDDYSTYADFSSSFCISIHKITHNEAPTLFYKSQITAMNLDGLTAVTVPGEVAMEVGWQILRDARDRTGIDPLDSWVFGYAQDHQFYIMPTNLRGELPVFPGISTPMAPDDYPDFAFSWLQGGYEATVSTWGWLMGDFIVGQAVTALEILGGTPVDVKPVYPQVFSSYNDEPFDTDTTAPEDAGRVTQDVPGSVERFEPVEFAWIGGDPGAEAPLAPVVTLERAIDGVFEPVVRESLRLYDNREPVMLTRVRPHSDGYEWIVRWEETKAFPAGTYRFSVAGHHWDGSARVPYQTTSAEFELVPSNGVIATVNLDANGFAGTLAYPAAPPLEFVGTDEDPGAVTGSFRMRHPLVGTGVPDPLVAGQDVTAADIVISYTSGANTLTVDPADITVETSGDPPVTTFQAPAPSGNPTAPTVSVTDAHGNSTP